VCCLLRVDVSDESFVIDAVVVSAAASISPKLVRSYTHTCLLLLNCTLVFVNVTSCFELYSVFTHTNPSFFDGSATHATADLMQTTEAFDGAVNNHQNETSLAHQFEGRVPESAENNHATNKMLHCFDNDDETADHDVDSAHSSVERRMQRHRRMEGTNIETIMEWDRACLCTCHFTEVWLFGC
jgi:hypothetical protein